MSNQDKELERFLGGDTRVSRAYRAAADAEPPVHLDEAIQAAARRAVGSRPRTAFSPFGRHWVVPATSAAVLVLAVGLVTFLSYEGAPLSPGETTKEVPAEMADKGEALRPDALGARPAPSASGTAMPQSKPVPAPARETAAEERKRSEAGSAATLQAARVAAEEATAAKARKPRRENLATAPSPASRDVAAAGAVPASKAGTALADVLSVATSGSAGAYQFAVTVRSADTGCQQYADWWEVLSEDGRLLYRRVLLHSHVDEQPFTRSGGPVPIAPDTVVWVRAHMHPVGYGGTAMRGSARAGFRPAALAADFSAALAQQAPLPGGCDF